MAFLNETDGLLQIEDILPLFDEFTLIDDFKEEICNALEQYNEQITELKNDMDQATRSADELRLDIKNLRNKYVVLLTLMRKTNHNIADMAMLDKINLVIFVVILL